MKKSNQSGFGLLVVLVVLVVLGAVAFAGYRIVSTNNQAAEKSAQVEPREAQKLADPSEFSEAEKTLDDTSFDEGIDESKLNEDISPLL